MKRYIAVLLIFMIFALTGCSLFITEEPYTFRQDFDQIRTIEILKKEYDSIRTDTPMNVIKTLDVEEHQEIVDALLSAEGARVGLEPGTGFGFYIIRITYEDGEKEMIGDYNNGYILPDGTLHQDIYSFDTIQFYDIISHFLGEEVTDVPGMK